MTYWKPNVVLDREMERPVKIAAAQAGQSLRQWFREAIEEKLAKTAKAL